MDAGKSSNYLVQLDEKLIKKKKKERKYLTLRRYKKCVFCRGIRAIFIII
jgi:hypothetical protein